MSCFYCPLIMHCSGIGECANNKNYLKEYTRKHPGKIVTDNLARQICNMSLKDKDSKKELQKIKESLDSLPEQRYSGKEILMEIRDSLYSLAEQKQVDMFRLSRRILEHNGNPSLARSIRDEAFRLTEEPDILLKEDELEYVNMV